MQVLEIWKMLLDPENMEGPVEKNRFLELFYATCIGQLTDALAGAGPPKVPRRRPRAVHNHMFGR